MNSNWQDDGHVCSSLVAELANSGLYSLSFAAAGIRWQSCGCHYLVNALTEFDALGITLVGLRDNLDHSYRPWSTSRGHQDCIDPDTRQS